MMPYRKNIEMYNMTGLKQTCSITNIALKAAKKLCVSRSTGTSNMTYIIQMNQKFYLCSGHPKLSYHTGISILFECLSCHCWLQVVFWELLYLVTTCILRLVTECVTVLSCSSCLRSEKRLHYHWLVRLKQ